MQSITYLTQLYTTDTELWTNPTQLSLQAERCNRQFCTVDQWNSVGYDFMRIYPRKPCLSPSNLRCLDTQATNTHMWSHKGPKAGNATDLKYVYYLILKTQITDEVRIAIKGGIECPEQSSFWEMFYTAYISVIIYSRTYKSLGDIQKCNIDPSEHIQERNIVLLVVLPLRTCSL